MKRAKIPRYDAWQRFPRVLLEKHPPAAVLPRGGVAAAVIAALLFAGIGLASAAYIGPQRTVTTTVWQRESCQYRAYTPSPAGWCYLTLYFPPSSCPSTSSVADYFNPAPTACGTSWPGTCGAGISCTITLQNDSRQGCSSGQPGCTRHTSTTAYPPATVSGTTVCTLPGDAGWCRGTATIDLAGDEPLAPAYSLTYFEGDVGVLCEAPSCTWTFPEGATDLSYWVHSSFGDTSTMSSASMKVDSMAPEITLDLPAPDGLNGWFVSPVTASASATDATSGLSGLPSINGGGPTLDISSDGVYGLTAVASDIAGNTGSVTGSVQLDATAPVAGFSIPAPDGENGWYVSPVTVVPDGSDVTSGIDRQQLSLDYTIWSDSLTLSADGIYDVHSRAVDKAGNPSQVISRTLSLDMTPPELSLVLPPTVSGWYASQPAVTAAASDATSGVGAVDYSTDGGPWASSIPALADGMHTLRARAADQAGNVSVSVPATIQLDTTGPQSAFVSPAEGSSVVAAGVLDLWGTASDLTSGVAAAQISLDNGVTWLPLTVSGDSWSYSWDTGKVPNGTYEVMVSASDFAGNQGGTARLAVRVDNDPPTVSITREWIIWQAAVVQVSSHALPVAGGRITISNPAGDEVQSFEYASGGPPGEFRWDGLTSHGKAVPFGLYTVKVEIWDAYGHRSSASGTVLVPAPQPTATAAPLATATPTAVPQPTAAALASRPPGPAPTAAPLPWPVSIGQGNQAPLAGGHVDPLFLWPALALGAFLAVLGASSFSDKKHQAYRNLHSAVDRIMQRRLAARASEEQQAHHP